MRLKIKVALLTVVSFWVISTPAAAQIGSGGAGAHQFESGPQPGRMSSGVVAAPAAFSGGERPDTGSFMMSENLFSLPGRGLSVNLSLNYDSHLYQQNYYTQNIGHKTNNGWAVDAVRGDDYPFYDEGGGPGAASRSYIYTDAVKGMPAYGFTLGYGAVIKYGAAKDCYEYNVPSTAYCGTFGPPEPALEHTSTVFIDNTGARHQLNGATSNDGSDLRYKLESNTPTITYPDGTKITFGLTMFVKTGTLRRQEWYCDPNGIRRRVCTTYDQIYYPTKLIDRNGNYIQINYRYSNPIQMWGGPHISSIVDTLGRVIKFNYDSNGWRLLSITAPGFTPDTERVIVRFYYEGLYRAHVFSNQATYTEPVTTLRHLYFPETRTGLRYTYSSYGMIYKVERLRGMDVASDDTVTGEVVAYTEYDYPTTQNYSLNNIPTYTKRTDWWSGSTVGTVEHHFDVDFDWATETSTTTTTAPDQTISEVKKKWYPPTKRQGWINFWDDGLIKSLKISRDNKQYSYETYGWQRTSTGPRLLEQVSTLDGGQPKKVAYEYYDPPCPNGICAGVHSNVTKVTEYGFDGAEVRRTQTTYKTQETDPGYIDRWLVKLPTSVKVYAAGSTEPASQIDYAYDTDPNLTSYTGLPMYQDPLTSKRGNLTRASSNTNAASPGQGVDIVSTSKYDIVGNIVESIDPEDNVSQVEYSAAFHRAYATSTTSAVPDPNPADGVHGSATAFTTGANYNFNTGLIISSTDAEQQLTEVEYNDPALRPTRVIPPAGGAVVETEYGDEPGNLHVKVKRQIDADSWDEVITYYDSLGRTVKTQSQDAQGTVYGETFYDVLGRISKTCNPYRQGAEKHCVETVYDAIGRAEEVISPKVDNEAIAAKVKSEYFSSPLGAVRVGTNQAGKKSRSISNALGQIIRVDEPNLNNELGAIDAPVQPTSYKYDVLGRLSKVTQGEQARYFLYDSMGRLLRVRQPEQDTNPALAITDPVTDNGQWSTGFTYDKNGNMLTSTDAKGVVVNYDYDNLNRVIQRSYTIPQTTDPKKITVSTPTVTFKYDGVLSPTANNPTPAIVPFARGRLTETSNGVSMTQYTKFDNLGRIGSSLQITDGQEYPFKYEYNFAGALEKQTYPSGRVITHAFDDTGDLTSISGHLPNQAAKVYANNFRYTANGASDQLRLGNGNWETQKFNARQQVTQLGLGTSSTDTSLWKVDYDYGRFNPDGTLDVAKNDGNVIRQTITVPGVSQSYIQTYAYDALNRLSEAVETNGGVQIWKQNYGYDRYGNRTEFSYFAGQSQLTLDNVSHPAINPLTNRIQANLGYSYDLSGNLIQDATGSKYGFDADNKQREVKDSFNNIIATYSYDGSGRRVKKVVLARQETTIFVYDAAGKLIAEYSTKPPPTSGTNYITADLLTSPRVITNSAGEVTSRRDFMPFGELLAAGRSSAQKYSQYDGLRKSFTGYERDDETQLNYAEARYYNHFHGRFTSVDPLLASGKSINPQTFNRYVYSGNNPTLRVDPNGEDWFIHYTTKLYRDGTTVKLGTHVWDSRAIGSAGYTKVRNHVVFFTHGTYTGWHALDPWENRVASVSSYEEGLAQIEFYRRQAALNFIVGAAEAASLAVDWSGLGDKFSVDRQSEQYKLGRNTGTIISGMAAATGGGLVVKGFDVTLKKVGPSVARGVKVVGPGAFSKADVALGVHEHLQAFKGSAQIGSDFKVVTTLMDAIKGGIDKAVAGGGKIRFNLDGFDPKAALDPLSPFYDKYTSQEFRYVLEKYRDSTIFYRNGQQVSSPF